KAFRVFNSRTRIVQETLHVNFMENKPNVTGFGPAWLFDIDSLTQTMNYHPVHVENQTNSNAGFQDTEKVKEEGTQTYVLFLVLSDGSTNPQNNKTNALVDGKEHDDDIQKFVSPDFHSLSYGDQTRKQGDKTENTDKGKSPVVTITGFKDLNTEFEECNNNSSNGVNAASSLVSAAGQNYTNSTNDFSAAGPSNAAMPNLEDLSQDADDVGVEADINNMESIISVSPIPTTRIHKDHPTSQIIDDLSSTTQTRSMARAVRDQGLQVKQKKDGIFISQDKYVAEILKKFGLSEGKSASTPIDAEKPLLKDSDGEDVDVHTYRSMIGSLMYLTSSRLDIMFAVCACARFQVTSKVSHLNAVKRIFRYLKGKPYLGFWYPKDSPFDLVAYSDSDYTGASLDRKSTTRGCQFLGCRLISWQCKKQTVVATSSTEAEYVAAASGYAQVLWIQNQLLDYGVFNSPMLHVMRVEMVINSPWMLSKNWLVQKQTAIEKSDAAEGSEQIIDFLSGSYIHYALTVNPHIYISCIKQFSNSVSVKCSGDVTRLQALVDKKKIVIFEAVIREILQLNDAEGVVCLPNEEIFAGLAQMGTSWNEFSTTMASAVIYLSEGQKFNFSKYIFNSLVRNVDSSSKFYMYPHFIQLIILNQVGYLSTHTTRFISPALTQKVFANMRRVGKGFSGVKTPLFEGMLAARQPTEEELVDEQVHVDAVAAAVVEDVVETVAENVSYDVDLSSPPHDIPSPSQAPSSPPHQPPCPPQPQDAGGSSLLFQQVLDTCSALARRVEGLENDKAAQQLEIVKLKARVKKLEKINMVKSSKLRQLKMVGTSQRVESSDDMENVFNQGRIIVDMDQDEGIELVADQEKDAEVVAASTPIPAVSTRRRKRVVIRDPEEELPSDTLAETPKVKDKGKGILIEATKPMKKKDQIEMDAEYARKLQEEINKEHEETYKNIDWNAALDHVQSKEPQYIKRYHGMKKKPQTESEACKNMIFYLKKLKSREEMEAKDQEIIKSINETPAQKAAKRRKLSKEAQKAKDLRKRLEIVQDEDDDVFVKATTLAQKVPVMDYQMVVIDNKPRYKIIRADDTHQLYISFTTLLKNFDREDLETTLKTMFEEPDGQDAIWRN
nr:uncharacterized mitochondrial protein AtMg00810-like [Tanacetum cinerariifolium]